MNPPSQIPTLPPGEITGGPGPGQVPGGAGAGAPGLPDPNVQAADAAMRAMDPKAFDIASQYFPGQTAAGGPKRLFRLTRAQLDRVPVVVVPAQC